ncbi:MAG TPA: winged helix-turn-helix domain-containing protein [Candidatus Angelobacter sp.]|nr:winged helix-turn-helix domain-containing protein [Candidatus Angelobacter sp.]
MTPALKYSFDDYEADLRAAELRRNGNRLKLQMQPFQVLVALLERPRDVVTREELRQRLWPEDTFVDFDHGLNTAVAKLRDVLGDSPSAPRYIETIAKRGYRFLADVAVTADQLSLPDSKAANSSAAATFGAEPPEHLEKLQAPGEEPYAQSPIPDPTLPRASRGTSRALFLLAQIMYVAFYLSALFRIDELRRSAYMAWHGAGQAAFAAYLLTALVGLVMRLYLIAAIALDYHLLGEKYRILFPALFLLDMMWALSPFLIADRIGPGLALAATAALIYMPFAQRVLMKMMQAGR